MRAETQRLLLAPPGAGDVDDLLAVFNSNSDFIDASELHAGKRAYDRGDVEMYLYTETSRENGRCVSIRLREGGELVGTASVVAPHPSAGCPWIGLLIMRADRQEQGLGAEAAGALEEALAEEGWPEVRLSVLEGNERALRFWQRLGYEIVDAREDTNKRPCFVLAKRL